jgi:hypothetical protein
MHLAVILISLRMFEVLNFLFIYRWLTNIKIDIIKFIRIIKHKSTSNSH